MEKPDQETEDRVVRALISTRRDCARDVQWGMEMAMGILLGAGERDRIIQRVKDEMGEAYYE